LHVASRTKHHASHQKASFLIEQSLVYAGRSEPRNFANWPVEFCRIFCGKQWAL